MPMGLRHMASASQEGREWTQDSPDVTRRALSLLTGELVLDSWAWCLTEAKTQEFFSCQRVALQAPFSFPPGARQVSSLHPSSYQLSELELADAFQDLRRRGESEALLYSHEDTSVQSVPVCTGTCSFHTKNKTSDSFPEGQNGCLGSPIYRL